MKTFALPTDDFRDEIEQVLPKLHHRVIAANVPNFEKGSGYLWHKGDLVQANETTRLALASLALHAPKGYTLHLIELDEGDITEDEAGVQLARLVAGAGVELQGPHESRVNLLAKERGLLKIDLDRLDPLNEITGVAVFTLLNDMTVEAGAEVTGVKVTPLVYPAHYFKEIAQICQGRPIVDVKPFRPRRIGVIYRELLKESVRQRFIESVQHKIGWFGSEVAGVIQAQSNQAEIVALLEKYKAQGVELVLHVGGHASDPLDPIFGALEELGARMERQGAPAHPGSLFWLAYWNEMTIFGLASCGMFSQTTLGDLFLAKFCAGEHLTNRDIAKLGHGGLFTRDMAFRFPQYGNKKSKN